MSPRRQKPAHERMNWGENLPLFIAMILAFALIGALWTGVFADRNKRVSDSQLKAADYAYMIGSQFDQNLVAVDLVLTSLGEGLVRLPDPGGPGMASERQQLLARASRRLPFAVDYVVYAMDGRAVAGSRRPMPPEALPLSNWKATDVGRIAVVGDEPTDFSRGNAFFIRHVFNSPSGQPVIGVEARFSLSQTAAFRDLSARLSPHDLALADAEDRILLAWVNGDPVNPNARPIHAAPMDTLVSTQGVDKTGPLARWVYGQYQLNDFPLRIAVAIARETVLVDWWQSVRRNIVVSLVIIALIVTSAIASWRQKSRRRRMENRTEAIRQRYARVFAHAGLGIAQLNEDYRIALVNPSLEALLGAAADALVGRDLMDFIGADDRPAVARLLNPANDDRYVSRHQCPLHRVDGSTVWCELTITRIPDLWMGSGYSICMFADISDRHRIEEDLQAMNTSLDQQVRRRTLDLVREVHERSEAEAELRLHRHYLRTILDNLPAAVWLKDSEGRYLQVNEGFAADAGYATNSELIGLTAGDHMPFDDAERTAANDQRVISSGQRLVLEESIAAPQERWFETSILPVLDDNGHVVATTGLRRDITERRRIQGELERQRLFFETVINTVIDPIVVTDQNCKIILLNDAARRSPQFNPPQMALPANPGCHWLGRTGLEPCAPGDMSCPLRKVLAEGETYRGLIEPSNQGHRRAPVYELLASPYRNTDGAIVGIVQLLRDVTDEFRTLSRLRDREERLIHMAQHDSLTGLPNRLLLMDRLEQGIRRAKRRQTRLGLLFVDLDHFKEINDSLGHAIGDGVLKQTAARLRVAVRAEDTVARLGGDEFVLLVEALEDTAAAETVAGKLIRSLADPLIIDGKSLTTGSSIGISLFPDDAPDAMGLLANADAAMYRAKTDGGNTYRRYNPSAMEPVVDRSTLSERVQAAIENGDLTLVFEPQVDLANGRLVGVETLVRWHHSPQGLILPDRFFPVAEDADLMATIDTWVLKTASAAARDWETAGLRFERVAVNLSAMQYRTPSRLISIVETTLGEVDLPASKIEIDIPESLLMTEGTAANDLIGSLSTMGLGVAIDDFGSGFFSIAGLQRLPVNRVKIDGSFIKSLPDSPRSRSVVTAAIQLSRALGFAVVAKDVETAQQRDLLASLACDTGQGFFFSYPLDAKAFLQWAVAYEAARLAAATEKPN